MRAIVPFIGHQPSVPTIPPCDFDSELLRATSSPDASAPSFGRRPKPTFRYILYPRRRCPRFPNFLAGLRYRTLDAIDFISRFYVRFCVLIVTVALAIYLGTVISMLTRAEPLPPLPSPSCPASNSPATTSLAVTRGFKF
ncbi:MAG: hypothetical protein OXF11_01110 [Deltaproteobacteria bacterium]|nr:hypothetical protein [Deltaproteobacteria bacterium]